MPALLLALALAANPVATKTGVLIITHSLAEIPVEPERFAGVLSTEVDLLADHWVTYEKTASRNAGCSLETFMALGFEPSLCGISAPPADIERLLVFELSRAGRDTVLTAAVWEPGKGRFVRRLEHRVIPGQTRAAAARYLFRELFSEHLPLRFLADHDSGFVFVDGQWLGAASELGERLIAPGRHVLEVRRGADRVRLPDLVVAARPKPGVQLVDLRPAPLTVAAR